MLLPPPLIFEPSAHQKALQQRRAICRSRELRQNEERSDKLVLILYD